MAASVSATFRLIDKASGTLDRIAEKSAKLDAALVGLGDRLDAVGHKLDDTTVKAKALHTELNALSGTYRVRIDTSGMAGAATQAKAVRTEMDAMVRRSDNQSRKGGIFSRLLGVVPTGGNANAQAMLGDLGAKLDRLQRPLKGVTAGVAGAATAFGRMGLIVVGLLPLLAPLAGAITALGGSLAFAAGGAGLIAGGAAGVLAVGLGSVFAVAKSSLSPLKSYTQAVASLNKAMASGNPQAIARAQQRVNQMAKAHPGIAKLRSELDGLKKTFADLTRPSQTRFFGLAAGGIKVLRSDLHRFKGDINNNFKAFADAVQRYIYPFLRSREFKRFIDALSGTFQKSIGPLMQGLTRFFGGFINLIEQALPRVQKMSVHFDRMGKSFQAWSGQRSHGTVQRMIRSFNHLEHLLGSAARLLGALFSQSQPAGESMITNLTKTFNRWTEWINTHPKKMHDFFTTAVADVSKLTSLFGGLVGEVFKLSNMLEPVLQAFLTLGQNLGPGGVLAGLGAYAGVRGLIKGVGAAAGRGAGGALSRVPGLGGLGGALAGRGGISGIWGYVAPGSSKNPIAVVMYGSGGGGGGLPVGGLPGKGDPGVAGERPGFFARVRGGFSRAMGTRGGRALALGAELTSIPTAVRGVRAATRGVVGQSGRVAGVAERLGPAGRLLGRIPGISFGAAGLGALLAGGGVESRLAGAAGMLDPTALLGFIPGLGNFQGVGASAIHGIASMFSGGPTAGKQIVGDVRGDITKRLAGVRDPTHAISILRGEHQRLVAAQPSVRGVPGHMATVAGAQTWISATAPGGGSKDVAREAQQVTAAIQRLIGLRDSGKIKGFSTELSTAFDTAIAHGQKMGPALEGTTKLMLSDLHSLSHKGQQTFAQGYLSWEAEQAKGNPKLEGKLADLRNRLNRHWKAIGDDTYVVSNTVFPSLDAAFTSVSNNLVTQASAARAGLKTNLDAIVLQMNQVLKSMGFSPSQVAVLSKASAAGGQSAAVATGVVKGVQAGQIGKNSVVGATSLATAPHALGGRIAGQGMHDNVHLGGGNMAAPGELIVNSPTEGRINRMLRHFGTSLGWEVANEGIPHYARPYGGPANTGRAGAAPATQASTGLNFNGHPSNVHPGVARAIATIIGQFPGLAITSTTDLGHAKGSLHYAGEAIDVAGTPALMNRAARWIDQSMGKNLTEGIHNTGLSVKNGAEVPPSFWGSTVWGEHANHIHIGVAGALGALGAAMGGVTGAAVPTLARRQIAAGGLVGGIAQAGTDAATAAAQRILNTAGGGGGVGAALGAFKGGGGTSGANQALGKRMMLAAGWPASEWPALKALWTQESGWDSNAVNKSSGAYGIPQALGHGHPFSLGDASSQIAWGLNYIKGRYGSPSAAEGHERAFNWYSHGGRIPFAGWYGDGGSFTAHRPTYVGVGDGGAETVTVSKGTSAGGIHIDNLTIHGGRDVHDEVMRAFRDLDREMHRHSGGDG